jgi:hypothetical protein
MYYSFGHSVKEVVVCQINSQVVIVTLDKFCEQIHNNQVLEEVAVLGNDEFNRCVFLLSEGPPQYTSMFH